MRCCWPASSGWCGAMSVAGGFDVRADPPYVRQACEASLRRLGVDEIDLYYLHHRSETDPDRGDRRSHGRTRRPGKGARPGPVQRDGGRPTPRTRRPPDRGAAGAVVGASRDIEQQLLPTVARPRSGRRGPLPDRSWTACTRARERSRRAGSQAACMPHWTRSPSDHDATAGRSHWPGCITGSRHTACRSSRSPGRPASATYAPTSPRPT